MPEAQDRPTPIDEGSPDATAAAARVRVNWRRIWPIPVLAGAAVLFAGGLITAMKSRPKPDLSAPVREATRLIEAGKFEEALDRLNTKALAAMRSEDATEEMRAEFFAARADALSLAQTARGLSFEQNERAIIDDYRRAQQLGLKPDPAQAFRLARAYLGAGEVEAAAELARGLETPDPSVRHRLLREVAERVLNKGGASSGLAEAVLTELVDDPGVSGEDRLWAVSRQAEKMLDAGRVDAAIDSLLRAVQRVGGLGTAESAGVHVLLGRAYFVKGELGTARIQLETAQSMLPASSERLIEARVLLGRVAQAEGRRDAAREIFAEVVESGTPGTARGEALLGLAETEASLGDHGHAFELYAELTELARAPEPRLVRVDHLRISLEERYTERLAVGDFEGSLKYAQMAEVLYPDGSEPAGILAALARAHRSIADGLMAEARESEKSGGAGHSDHAGVADVAAGSAASPAPSAEHGSAHAPVQAAAGSHGSSGGSSHAPAHGVSGDPAHHADEGAAKPGGSGVSGVMSGEAMLALSPLERAKRHYLAAGDEFRRLSAAVVIEDAVGYLDALWNAADCFDLGGDHAEAIKAFGDYRDGSTEDDARRPEAIFRLARIYQARGEFSTAESLYLLLIEGAARPVPPKGIGPWADASIVPLAVCYVMDADEGNDPKAEELLLGVLDGRRYSPESRAFRDAIIRIGWFYYDRGKTDAAIPKLDEAVRRYPEDPRIHALRFRLADSYRAEAGRLAERLKGAMPQDQRQELILAREANLRQAMNLFQAVRDTYEARGTADLTDLERVELRNAMFYLGDCAYELGDYAAAIEYADDARLRYSNDPASLVAMVQIVNAYVEQGEWDLARTAQERARQHLERLGSDDRIWNNPNLPMERKHWERWLDSKSLLDRRAGADEQR